jgi:tetratricopeptide (TPR) repeat protein
MAAIGFSDRFRRLGREYLIQTSANEARKIISCSLFHSGLLINSRSFPLPESPVSGSLLDHVSKVHEQCLRDIDSLLGLVERMSTLDKPEIIEKLGKTLCSRELFDEGRELLTAAVQRYPDLPGLRFVLGKLYLAKGIYDEAVDHLSRAVDLAPSYPDYRNLLGYAYLMGRKPVAAIDEFKKAVEQNVYFDEAYFNLGLGFILNGIVREDFNLAKNLVHNCLEAFGKATLFNPAYINDDYENGIALLRENRLEQAFEMLSGIPRKVVSHHSEERLLEMYLRYIHGEDGMTEEGIRQYVEKIDELLKSNPGHADLHNELGMAYTVMCKLMNNRAIEHFKEALRINPSFIKAARNLKLSQNDLKGFEVLLEAIVK